MTLQPHTHSSLLLLWFLFRRWLTSDWGTTLRGKKKKGISIKSSLCQYFPMSQCRLLQVILAVGGRLWCGHDSRSKQKGVQKASARGKAFSSRDSTLGSQRTVTFLLLSHRLFYIHSKKTRIYLFAWNVPIVLTFEAAATGAWSPSPLRGLTESSELGCCSRSQSKCKTDELHTESNFLWHGASVTLMRIFGLELDDRRGARLSLILLVQRERSVKWSEGKWVLVGSQSVEGGSSTPLLLFSSQQISRTIWRAAEKDDLHAHKAHTDTHTHCSVSTLRQIQGWSYYTLGRPAGSHPLDQPPCTHTRSLRVKLILD